MDCPEARELLNEELDGRLAPDAAARLAAHVAGCSACAQERRDLASLRATFRAMPRAPAPAGFKDGVMGALPRGRVRTFPRVAGWIAAVAAVVVLSVTVLRSGRDAAERDVASATPAKSRVARKESRDEPGAPSPELTAATNAEPVAPPRPGESGSVARRDETPGAPPAGEKSDAKSGDGLTQTAPEGEADAAKPAAPPAATAPAPPPADVAMEETAHEVPETVRYVVFTDAAAAQRFADDLAAAQAPRAKDKASLDDAEKGLAQGATATAPAAPAAKAAAKKQDAARDLLKEAAFRTRRVVARTPLAGALRDAELAASAAAVGGALLPAAETTRFTELLDAPATAAAPELKREAAADSDERKAKPREPVAGGGKSASRGAPPPVVVVIVVLEETAKAPAEKR